MLEFGSYHYPMHHTVKRINWISELNTDLILIRISLIEKHNLITPPYLSCLF